MAVVRRLRHHKFKFKAKLDYTERPAPYKPAKTHTEKRADLRNTNCDPPLQEDVSHTLQLKTKTLTKTNS